MGYTSKTQLAVCLTRSSKMFVSQFIGFILLMATMSRPIESLYTKKDCEKGGSCEGTIIYGGLVKKGKPINLNGPAVQNKVPCAKRIDSWVDSPCIEEEETSVVETAILEETNGGSCIYDC